jgi:hypothetical protein
MRYTYAETLKNIDRQRSRFVRGPNIALTQENIDTVTLTDVELDLILKIHHAVLKGTIDASYVVDKDNENTLMQIVSRLE